MKHYKELCPDAEPGIEEAQGVDNRNRVWTTTKEPVCPRCGPNGELVRMIEGDGPLCQTCDMPVHAPLKPEKPWLVITAIAVAIIVLYTVAGLIA